MLNTIKIEFLRKTKVLKQKEIAEKLGMNVNTYGKLVKNGNFRVNDLIKLASLLEVHVTELFDKPYAINEGGNKVEESAVKYNKTGEDVEVLKSKNKLLTQIIKDKDEIIKLLKDK